MTKVNSHCRKPDCRFHPSRNFGVLNIFGIKCMRCKYFVLRDNYKPTNEKTD